jgi:hypothetical protein
VIQGHHGKGKPCPCCGVMDLPVPMSSHILGEYGQQIGLMSVTSVNWIIDQLKNLGRVALFMAAERGP